MIPCMLSGASRSDWSNWDGSYDGALTAIDGGNSAVALDVCITDTDEVLFSMDGDDVGTSGIEGYFTDVGSTGTTITPGTAAAIRTLSGLAGPALLEGPTNDDFLFVYIYPSNNLALRGARWTTSWALGSATASTTPSWDPGFPVYLYYMTGDSYLVVGGDTNNAVNYLIAEWDGTYTTVPTGSEANFSTQGDWGCCYVNSTDIAIIRNDGSGSNDVTVEIVRRVASSTTSNPVTYSFDADATHAADQVGIAWNPDDETFLIAYEIPGLGLVRFRTLSYDGTTISQVGSDTDDDSLDTMATPIAMHYAGNGCFLLSVAYSTLYKRQMFKATDGTPVIGFEENDSSVGNYQYSKFLTLDDGRILLSFVQSDGDVYGRILHK